MVTAFAILTLLLTLGFIAEELGTMLRRKQLALERARPHKTIVAIGKQPVRTLGDLMVVLDQVNGAEVRVDFSDGDRAWAAVHDGVLGPFNARTRLKRGDLG